MNWVKGRQGKKVVVSTKYFCTGFHKDPCKALGWEMIYGNLGEREFALGSLIGLAYQGWDIVFRVIIEYSNLMDFGPLGTIIGLFFI
jgi:hypothetical protein